MTGTPTSSRTFASTSSPFCQPGPRFESTEVRFALSYEALKTNGTCRRLQIDARSRAIAAVAAKLSTRQGPAMIASSRPPITLLSPTRTSLTFGTLIALRRYQLADALQVLRRVHAYR